MTDVTHILSQIDQGDPRGAEQLLPLVYDELRRLATKLLVNERPDHTLQATALVHEAYTKLFGTVSVPGWKSRRHFFCVAANAMRQILVDSARRKRAAKRGGNSERMPLDSVMLGAEVRLDDLLDLDDALQRLEQQDPNAAQLVKLRVFTGLSIEEAAAMLEISPRSAYRDWSFAKAWLFRALGGSEF